MIGGAGHEPQAVGHGVEIDHDGRIVDGQRRIHLRNFRGSTSLQIDGDNGALRRNADYRLVAGPEINTDERIDSGHIHGLGDLRLIRVENDQRLFAGEAQRRRGKAGGCSGDQNGRGNQGCLEDRHWLSPSLNGESTFPAALIATTHGKCCLDAGRKK